MPCDLGYKVVARVKVPEPLPQEFKEEVRPPTVDQDLLEKIGENDPAFLAWMKELDIKPLLVEALKRAINKVVGANQLNASINPAGRLALRAAFNTAAEEKRLKKLSAALGNQFQMEVLGVIAQLLDYEVLIGLEEINDEVVIVLQAEKHDGSKVHKYIKISKSNTGDGLIQFEHFASAGERNSELNKLLGLAQKLGVTLRINEVLEQGGQPIPHGVEHRHFLKEH